MIPEEKLLSVIARFEAERQALAMMDDPGIARVYEAGATDEGRPFFRRVGHISSHSTMRVITQDGYVNAFVAWEEHHWRLHLASQQEVPA